MCRLIAVLQTTVLLAGLLVLAVPADLACCAGVAEIHGPSCCESTETDALARSCCEGDGTALPLRFEPPLTPPPPVAVALSPSNALTGLARLARLDETTNPLPPDKGLFTLHSAWLI